MTEDKAMGLRRWLSGPNKKTKGESGPEHIALRNPNRVAVLPFTNISPDSSDEYFSDGMTEELIASLSGIRDLTVIARTSVMKYKSAHRGISEVVKDLNAGTLIEGSVRKSGNKVRITVQQIDARTEGHLWVQTYDRELGDIFAIQSEIAGRVSEQLKIQLVEPERERLEKKPTENTETYLLYLKGKFYWNERSPEGYTRAIEYYDQAIKRDPAFAPGYSGLALCYGTLLRNQMGNSASNYRLAKDNCLKALEIDPNLAEAHAALGSILTNYDRNQVDAEREFKRAIRLNPSYATAHHWYSIFLLEHRRFEEGLAQIKRAVDLDPHSLIINNSLADHLYYQDLIDDAIRQFRKLMEMNPNFVSAHLSVIQPYIRKGLYDDALAEAEIYAKLSGVKMYPILVEAWVSAAMGNTQQSSSSLKNVRSNYKSGEISPYLIALAHFSAHDEEEGFLWLHKAFDNHDSWINLMAVDFELENVRNDPRYKELLTKAGLGDVRF